VVRSASDNDVKRYDYEHERKERENERARARYQGIGRIKQRIILIAFVQFTISVSVFFVTYCSLERIKRERAFADLRVSIIYYLTLSNFFTKLK
jgi:hypothetical protein